MEKTTAEEIREKILLTISYFNLLNYPPTAFEIWRHLITEKKVDFCSIIKELETLIHGEKIFCAAGCYYLFGKEKILVRRRCGKKIAVGKIKRMTFWTRRLRGLPFVRGIFVRGALALGTAENHSDWDALVVTAPRRIWLGRLVIIIFLQLLGKRRKGRKEKGKIKDRFCLNHFLAMNGLILEKQNQFIAHEESFSLALWGNELQRKFLGLNNQWLKRKRANFEADQLDNFWNKQEPVFLKNRGEEFLEKIGWAEKLNSLVKKWMIKMIKNNPKSAWLGADIRYSDQALIFIPNPWRDNLEEEARKEISVLMKR